MNQDTHSSAESELRNKILVVDYCKVCRRELVVQYYKDKPEWHAEIESEGYLRTTNKRPTYLRYELECHDGKHLPDASPPV